MIPELAPYVVLIQAFVEGRLTASEFEHIYLRMFTGDPTFFPQEIYEILNGLFSDTDSYCADASLREPDDLDDEGLRKSARHAADKLNEAIATL